MFTIKHYPATCSTPGEYSAYACRSFRVLHDNGNWGVEMHVDRIESHTPIYVGVHGGERVFIENGLGKTIERLEGIGKPLPVATPTPIEETP